MRLLKKWLKKSVIMVLISSVIIVGFPIRMSAAELAPPPLVEDVTAGIGMDNALAPPIALDSENQDAVTETEHQDAAAETEHLDVAVAENQEESHDSSVLPLNEGGLTDIPLFMQSLNNGNVTVEGMLPEGAALYVAELPSNDAQYLLGTQSEILFAYDITIMVNGMEYQPSQPVTTRVAAAAASIASVEVFHINEDLITGETNIQGIPAQANETGEVQFHAEGFSIYIGTIVNGMTLTLAAGSGYIFYSDSLCENAISGSNFEVNNSSDTAYIYVKPSNVNYRITSVQLKDMVTGSVTAVSAPDDGDIWTIPFPVTMHNNQQIIMETYVKAPGGSITSSSTAEQIAAIFDATASSQSETNNVSVSSNGSLITVAIKNNILLCNTITLEQDVNMCIISSGNYIIKRDFGYGSVNSHMFLVKSLTATLSLGRGSIQSNSVTYHFNTGEIETNAVGTVPTESTDDRYVTYTTVNAVVESNLAGTLIIDGGAGLQSYSGTGYSWTDSSRHTGNIIRSNNGEVNVWGGVTLQNNQVKGNDTAGGSAINIQNGRLNLYGGTISHCVCSDSYYNPPDRTGSSRSDGGALMLCGSNTKTIIHNIRIVNCEADNSSAISIWSGAQVFFLNGTIQNNLSIGDMTYPAQAVSVYEGSVLYMYGGTISDNQGMNCPADLRISSAGNNVLHLFGGTIGSIGSNAQENTVNIHAGQVGDMMGLTAETDMIGTVNHYGGTSLAVTLSDAVAVDGSQSVDVMVYSGGQLVREFSTSGTGTQSVGNSNLVLLLSNGDYVIYVESSCMIKTYEVLVNNDAITATPVNVALTEPKAGQVSESSVTLLSAGTGNASDGQISYGVSDTEDGQYSWQSSPCFLGQIGTKFYKVMITGGLNSAESNALRIVFQTPTISVGSDLEIDKGVTHTFTPIITPSGFPVNRIRWTISGNSDASTLVVKNSNGSGTVTVAVNEENSFILKAELLDENNNSYVTPVYDDLTITPKNKEIVNPPSFVVTIPETLNMTSNQGTFEISGQTFNFTTEILEIKLSSVNHWEIINSEGVDLSYALYTNQNRSIGSKVTDGVTCMTFLPHATETKRLYYTVFDTPIYSGTYRDTLCFNIAMTNS